MEISKSYLNIITPLGEQVGIELVEREESELLLEKELESIVGEFTIAFKKKKIYQLVDGSVLLDYTLSDYMIRLDSYDSAKKILYNEYYGIVILNRSSNNNYYYYFSLHEKHFREFPPNEAKKIDGAYTKYYTNFKGEKCYYKIVEHENGILYFFERVQGVYQGTWYPSIKDFRYFYTLEINRA